MADLKITQLPSYTDPVENTDYFVVVQDVDTIPETRKVTASGLLDYVETNINGFATLSGVETFTNKTFISSSNTIEETTQVTSSSSITPTGGSLRNYLKVTALAEGTTINAPSGTPADGNMLLMRIKDNGTSRTIAYNAIFRDIGVTRKTATTTSKTIYQLARYNSADSKWDIISVTEEA